jgi:transposase InsO family protein
LSHDYFKIDLCRAYGISRPTADKWIQRYQQGGVEQLEERSRAAHCHPNQTSEEVRQMLIDTKLYQQSWGPKKVLDYLRQNGPELAWPADSTAGEILKRAGLSGAGLGTTMSGRIANPLARAKDPIRSGVPTFKGDFALGNHRRCYPLTVSDNYSRYLLLCRALEHPSYQAVRPWLEWVFRQYGLPEAIRTDNGAPFASLAIDGVSELSKWWIKLGIRPGANQVGKAQPERSS